MPKLSEFLPGARLGVAWAALLTGPHTAASAEDLLQGRFDAETVYATDPIEILGRYRALGAKLILGVLPPWLKSMPSFSALCADCPPAVCHCETMVTPNHATVLPPTV